MDKATGNSGSGATTTSDGRSLLTAPGRAGGVSKPTSKCAVLLRKSALQRRRNLARQREEAAPSRIVRSAFMNTRSGAAVNQGIGSLGMKTTPSSHDHPRTSIDPVATRTLKPCSAWRRRVYSAAHGIAIAVAALALVVAGSLLQHPPVAQANPPGNPNLHLERTCVIPSANGHKCLTWGIAKWVDHTPREEPEWARNAVRNCVIGGLVGVAEVYAAPWQAKLVYMAVDCVEHVVADAILTGGR